MDSLLETVDKHIDYIKITPKNVINNNSRDEDTIITM